MNVKTNLLEEYVNFFESSLRELVKFVDSTKKKNTSFKIFLVLFDSIISLFIFFLFSKYPD